MTILLVEDDAQDAAALESEIGLSRPELQVRVVVDGQAALDYLNGFGIFGDRTAFPMPDAILLDLHLPVLDGHELLRRLHENPRWSQIPAAVLSGMLAPPAAQHLGARMCLVKPVGRPDLLAALDVILPEMAGATAKV